MSDRTTTVGALSVTPISDGRMRAPLSAMYPGVALESWDPYRDHVSTDGPDVYFEIGGYLVQSGDRLLLFDVGMGPSPDPTAGQFLTNLARQGVSPAQITDVVLTHLHVDHVGWAAVDGRPVFENATYRCHAADWNHFCGGGVGEPDPFGPGDALTPVQDHLELWTGDITLAAGLDLVSAPGHTPGSTVVVVSDAAERLIILGDVVHCPVDLIETEWDFYVDVDPVQAAKTRERWAKELEESGVAATAPHFPDLKSGRLLPASGEKRAWSYL